MKRGRFTEEQIIAVLREAESGTPVKELCRRAGVSTVTFYKWKSKCANMEISEVRRMRLLEDENARLKKIVAQQALDIDALKVVLSKKVVGPRAEQEAVRVAREEGKLSERRACGLISSRSGADVTASSTIVGQLIYKRRTEN
jgi:putative transposase